MKKLCFTIFSRIICIVVFVGIQSNCLSQRDEYRSQITPMEIRNIINLTPIGSSVHEQTISRACYSKLANISYSVYTELWEKDTKNFRLNYLRGISSFTYWITLQGLLMDREFTEDKLAAKIEIALKSCFKAALEANPKSAEVNRDYGFYLWQYGNDMATGLEMVRKSVQLAPSDSKCHCRLGEIYMNPSGNAFNMVAAERELRLAIKLNGNYIGPRNALISVLSRTKRYQEASEQHLIVANLGPKSMQNEPWFKMQSKWIQADLKKK